MEMQLEIEHKKTEQVPAMRFLVLDFGVYGMTWDSFVLGNVCAGLHIGRLQPCARSVPQNTVPYARSVPQNTVPSHHQALGPYRRTQYRMLGQYRRTQYHHSTIG
eukprot:1251945-Rhodomonas_salina.2